MIERKSGVLYELLIRGDFDSGANLGQFKGGHLVEAEAVVDTDTGEVLSYKQGAPVPISADRAKEYFGEQFASFNAGFDALKSKNIQLQADLDGANAKLAKLADELKSAGSALAEVSADVGSKLAGLAVVGSQIAGLSTEMMETASRADLARES